MHVHLYKHISYIYTCIHMYTRVYIYINVYTYTCTCIHIYTHVYIYIHMYTYIYIYIYVSPGCTLSRHSHEYVHLYTCNVTHYDTKNMVINSVTAILSGCTLSNRSCSHEHAKIAMIYTWYDNLCYPKSSLQ